MLELSVSDDLVSWKTPTVLLHDPERKLSLEWAYGRLDSEDLLVVLFLREMAQREDGDRSTRAHNLVFLRVPRWRERTPDTPPLCGPPLPKWAPRADTRAASLRRARRSQT